MTLTGIVTPQQRTSFSDSLSFLNNTVQELRVQALALVEALGPISLAGSSVPHPPPRPAVSESPKKENTSVVHDMIRNAIAQVEDVTSLLARARGTIDL